jgi:spore coat polysaccharide biosynthesis protein SpsF (cytidylyltransferase family)
VNCAVIQARMSSHRFPGKVLLEVDGRPLLAYMIERVALAKSIDKIVLATSLDSTDDPVAEFCAREKISCYRGSLDDVLDRYYQAASLTKCDTIVRLTGDCPLIDPQVIDTVLGHFHSGNYDYAANTAPPEGITYPEGMDVEAFSFAVLEQAWKETVKPSDREHVTFYFWNNPDKFSISRHDLNENLSSYRLTVDYPEDFEVIKAIITQFYPDKPDFSMNDIISFLRSNHKVRDINSKIKGFQGWQTAFAKDEKAGF